MNPDNKNPLQELVKSSFNKEDAFKCLDTVNMWINNCDIKVSMIIGIYGIFITIVFTLDYISIIKKILEAAIHTVNFFDVLYIIIVILSIVMFLFGMYKLINVIVPKIILDISDKSNQPKVFNSIMFFGSIAKIKTFDDYCEKVNSIKDEKEIFTDLLFQIYSASRICNSKFENQKKGLVFSICGLVSLCVLLITGYFIYIN